jgi:hypothetical protein
LQWKTRFTEHPDNGRDAMSFLNMIRQKWLVFVIVVLVALLAVGVLLRVIRSPEISNEDAGPQVAATSEPNNGTTLDEDDGSDTDPQPTPTFYEESDGFEPHIPEIDKDDCRNFMTEAEYASFMERLYQFEVVSQMQASENRLQLIDPFVTDPFFDTQKGFYESPVVEDVTITVDPGSAMACAMNSSNEIVARITPTITTVRQNKDGSEKVLQGPITLSVIHFTRWVLIDGIWYVDEERK